MDDRQIIALFFERSEQAITELANKYGSLCTKISFNILRSKEDAEECVNDAYLGAWNTIPQQNPNPLLSYICKIVRNLSIKKYHANTAKKRNSFYDIALDELEPCFPSANSIEEICNEKELTRLLNQFLASLDQQSRVMFVRRYFFADSISEIAVMFQISNHNATVRLSRIRNRLKLFLQKEGIYV